MHLIFNNKNLILINAKCFHYFNADLVRDVPIY